MFRRNERFDRQLMVIQEISRIQNANWATKHCEKCCVTDKHFGNPATSCYHQASPHVFQRYPFCLVVTPSQILMGEGKLLKYMASSFFKPRQTQKYHQKCMVCSEMSPTKLEKNEKMGSWSWWTCIPMKHLLGVPANCPADWNLQQAATARMAWRSMEFPTAGKPPSRIFQWFPAFCSHFYGV